MDCDICSRRLATIHIQEIINGDRRALHLCPECAAERQLGEEALKDFSLAEFLSSFAGLASDIAPVDQEPDYPDLTCEACGMTTAVFQEAGSFGCPSCYEFFGEILDELLPVLHRQPEYCGQRVSPQTQAMAAPVTGNRAHRLQMEVLKRELADAIAVENYERAANLRDEISRLEATDEET